MANKKSKLLIPMSFVASLILITLISQMYDNIEKEKVILDLLENLQEIDLELNEKSSQLEIVEVEIKQLDEKLSDTRVQQQAITSSLRETSRIIRNDIEDVERGYGMPEAARTELNRIRLELTSQLQILTKNMESILEEVNFNTSRISFGLINSAHADELTTKQRSLSKYYFAIAFLIMLAIALAASLGAAYLSANKDNQKSGEKMAHAIISFIIGGFTGSAF